MVKSNLARLTDDALREAKEREEIGVDGLRKKVRKGDLFFRGSDAKVADGQLEITFLRNAGQIEFTPNALDLPVDWERFECARFTVVNGDTPLILEPMAVGSHGRLIETRQLDAGEEAVMDIDLGDLPLAQSKLSPYEPRGLRIRARWGETWQTEGECVMTRNQASQASHDPVRVTVREIALVPHTSSGTRPVVDQFGQRIRGSWPTKVNSPDHMREVVEQEKRWLAETPEHPDRDEYGGWTAGPKFEATGFFRVVQDGERWWYVTPLGNVFWSIGTTGVRTTDCTVVDGREFLFEDLPDRNGPYKEVYGPCKIGEFEYQDGPMTIEYYHLNILKKWGGKEAWRDHVLKRFKVWGYNTIGCWSEEVMLRQQTVPHTRFLVTRIKGMPTVAGRMPDVWSDKWLALFEQDVERNAAPHKDDPWLLGYFCDNEMGWSGLYRKILDCPAAAAARDAFIEFMRGKYDSPVAVNAEFGTKCGSWDDVKQLTPDDFELDGAAQEAMHEFTGLYAEKYFSTVAKTIRKYDPNHLYLGCRFVRGKPEKRIPAAAGRHCDVVSINCYDLYPREEQFGEWYAECGKPIQLGEHCLPLASERMVLPPYPGFTAEERGPMYRRMIEKWARQPYSVGAHWFQHADMVGTGRPLGDGGNQPGGIVDITDRPHPELVEAVREGTAGMYVWHATSPPGIS